MKKKGLLFAALLLLAAVGAGIFFVANDSAEPVNVYPFHYLGMTEYWGDSRESYGPVTTDKIQTVFLSDTQIITEVLVQPGDMVKKGDILMTFDTTLDSLALERKRLEVEKLKLQRQAAQEKLNEIQNMVPLTFQEDLETETDTQNSGTALKGSHQIFAGSQYNGASPESAMICWLRQDAAMDPALLESLRQTSANYRSRFRMGSSASAEEVLEEIIVEVIEEEVFEEEPLPEEDPTEAPEEEFPTEAPEEERPTEKPSEEPEWPDTDLSVDSYYVVFKITAGNMSLGSLEVWQGIQVFGDLESGFAFKFFNASELSDHSVSLLPSEDTLTEILAAETSGYTAAQIAEMRSQQEKRIRDLAIRINMAEIAYNLAQAEVGDGHVYAKIDGKVISLLTETEARETKHPMIKVSGGGGFYIEGSISELELDGMALGQEVTVNDWNTGSTYTGQIVELRDFPTDQDNWNGTSNPNVSYYPFRVFVSEEADLQEGSHVSVLYSSAAAENGIYLENAFLRTQQGRSYVWLRGKDGKLEQRFVTTGKSLWGSYTEILSGLTEDDLLAFPYGKELKEGAPTVEADISVLYGY